MIRWGSKALRMHSSSRSPLAFISFPNRQPLSANRLNQASSQTQLTAFAEARITEGLHQVAEALGDRHEQAVLPLLLKFDRTSSVEIRIVRKFL